MTDLNTDRACDDVSHTTSGGVFAYVEASVRRTQPVAAARTVLTREGVARTSLRMGRRGGRRLARHAAARVRVRGIAARGSARHVVVALQTTLAGRLRYRPALPALRDALSQQMPAGAVTELG